MNEDENDHGVPRIALKAEGAPLPLLTRAFVPDGQRLIVRGFMCGTDWEHEIGQNAHGIEVWRSERDCARGKKCTDECGIVEVEVRILRTVKQPDF